MNNNWLSRPGAIQMLASIVLVTFASIGPIVLAIRQPGHEWLMSLSGLPALAMTIATVLVLALYCIGFLRYCASKGYSKWLGVCLLLGHFPGFIALLLLPDLQASSQA